MNLYENQRLQFKIKTCTNVRNGCYSSPLISMSTTAPYLSTPSPLAPSPHPPIFSWIWIFCQNSLASLLTGLLIVAYESSFTRLPLLLPSPPHASLPLSCLLPHPNVCPGFWFCVKMHFLICPYNLYPIPLTPSPPSPSPAPQKYLDFDSCMAFILFLNSFIIFIIASTPQHQMKRFMIQNDSNKKDSPPPFAPAFNSMVKDSQ